MLMGITAPPTQVAILTPEQFAAKHTGTEGILSSHGTVPLEARVVQQPSISPQGQLAAQALPEGAGVLDELHAAAQV